MTLTYRAEIDGLRAIAVLPVIFFHAGLTFASGGYIGVDVFFVISGYLIATIIFQKMATGTFSLLDFYENRARRILPALFIVMLACIPFAWGWMNPDQLQEFSQSLIWTSLFSSNVFFWMHSDYFASASEFKPLLHTWSLAVEEQYYLFFPVFILLFWRFGKTILAGLLTAVGVISLALCIWMASRYPEANFFLTPSRVWELLVGVACAGVLIKRSDRQSPGNWLTEVLAVTGLAAIVFSVIVFDDATSFPSAYALIPVLGTALIIIYASGATLIGRLLSLKPLVWIGLISYSAYLWHQPLFAFARIKLQGEPALIIMLGLSALSLILAYLSWRFVEQPFRRKSHAARLTGGIKLLNSKTSVFAVSILGALFFSALGYTQSTGMFQPVSNPYVTAVRADIKTLSRERAELIRYGRCHFQPPGKWKGNWDCRPGTGNDQGLTPVGIAIVGDSHGADKAMMLRLNGYSPYQYGGGGCSLTPSLMKKDCRTLFEFARQDIAQNPDIKEVWLSNRFSPAELEAQSVKDLAVYWQISGKRIIFFSGPPSYPNLLEKLFAKRKPEHPYVRTDFSIYASSTRKKLRKILSENDIAFVDMMEIICIEKRNCDYKDEDDNLLYIDRDHLSPNGAKQVGTRLIKYFQTNDVDTVFK